MSWQRLVGLRLASALVLPDVIFPVAQGATVCELEVCTVCAPGDHRQFLVPAL